MTEFKRQIPNILSVTRFFLAIICFYLAMFKSPVYLAFSLSIFLLAAFTDFLDGYLARKWNIITNFGKIADPIADKFLVLGIFFIFAYKGIVPFIFIFVIAFREILLTAIRLILLSKKVVIASINSGKFKTMSQMAVITAIYLILIFMGTIKQLISPDVIKYTIWGLTIWVVSITLYSGYEFFTQNTKALRKLAL